MEREPTIPAERLIEASDAVLLAAQELGRAGLDALPSSVMGAPSQPRALCDFTVYEVFEAELFLLRCGLLKLPRQRPTGV